MIATRITSPKAPARGFVETRAGASGWQRPPNGSHRTGAVGAVLATGATGCTAAGA